MKYEFKMVVFVHGIKLNGNVVKMAHFLTDSPPKQVYTLSLSIVGGIVSTYNLRNATNFY